jgi:hypothetical protein
MKKLRCDVCGKLYETLGGYGDSAPPGWWICLKCFAKADAIAKREDRWPEPRDFEKVARARR